MKFFPIILLFSLGMNAFAAMECKGRVQIGQEITHTALTVTENTGSKVLYEGEVSGMHFYATHFPDIGHLFLEIDHNDVILHTHLFKTVNELEHTLTAVDRAVAAELICKIK